jgi:hypothetical protein
VPSIVRGRIIYPKIAIPDPQGKNPKIGRPFVVISRDEDIKNLDHVQAIGITGELKESPPDHYVELPWGPTAKTGLKQKSAAPCSWQIEIPKSQVDVGKGFVRADLVDAIYAKVLQLNAEALKESKDDR